ncbi:MAG: helix-turn-helix transcriptional regulator [Sphingopyxis sp.]|nr:helix-turn-helix transcriptional regulator [Sphingopyxis sp.]
MFAPAPAAIRYADGRVAEGCCLLVEPNVAHRLEARGPAEIYFVEPTGRAAPSPSLRERICAILPPDEIGQGFWRDWIDRPGSRPIDPRIALAAAALDARLADGAVRLADIAGRSGLSEGRLRHLFAAEIGTPFRRYVLWRRLRAAIMALRAGEGLTGAAHDAGFADAAHLARTIRQMFGIRAGDAFRRYP